MIDSDRAAVYAAELGAFDGTDLESIIEFDRVAATVESVVATPWWPGPQVREVGS